MIMLLLSPFLFSRAKLHNYNETAKHFARKVTIIVTQCYYLSSFSLIYVI